MGTFLICDRTRRCRREHAQRKIRNVPIGIDQDTIVPGDPGPGRIHRVLDQGASGLVAGRGGGHGGPRRRQPAGSLALGPGPFTLEQGDDDGDQVYDCFRNVLFQFTILDIWPAGAGSRLTHYMLCVSINEYAHLEHKYLPPYTGHGYTKRW